jgi:cytochrome P450
MNTVWEFLTPEFMIDPYPVYARLRRESPVCEIALIHAYAVLRHDDVTQVLRAPEIFSSVAPARPMPKWFEGCPFSSSIVSTDPPRHAELRRRSAPAFAPPILAPLAEQVRRAARELLRGFAPHAIIDVISDFVVPLHSYALGSYLRLDAAHHVNVGRWSAELVEMVGPAPDREDALQETLRELDDLLREGFRTSARAPETDALGTLLTSHASLDDAMSLLGLVLVGGFETLVNALGNCFFHLARHRPLAEALRQAPSSVGKVITEILRYDSPVQVIARDVTRDTVIGDERILAGSTVMAVVGSALRDEAVFTNADMLDLARPSHASLAFGTGIHFCAGAPLALMVMRTALTELFLHFEDVSLAPDQELKRRPGFVLRGFASLPLQLGAVRGHA